MLCNNIKFIAIMSSSYSIVFWLSLCTVFSFYVFLCTLKIRKVLSFTGTRFNKKQRCLNHFLLAWPLTRLKKELVEPALCGSTTTCSSFGRIQRDAVQTSLVQQKILISVLSRRSIGTGCWFVITKPSSFIFIQLFC